VQALEVKELTRQVDHMHEDPNLLPKLTAHPAVVATHHQLLFHEEPQILAKLSEHWLVQRIFFYPSGVSFFCYKLGCCPVVVIQVVELELIGLVVDFTAQLVAYEFLASIWAHLVQSELNATLFFSFAIYISLEANEYKTVWTKDAPSFLKATIFIFYYFDVLNLGLNFFLGLSCSERMRYNLIGRQF